MTITSSLSWWCILSSTCNDLGQDFKLHSHTSFGVWKVNCHPSLYSQGFCTDLWLWILYHQRHFLIVFLARYTTQTFSGWDGTSYLVDLNEMGTGELPTKMYCINACETRQRRRKEGERSAKHKQEDFIPIVISFPQSFIDITLGKSKFIWHA